MPSPHSLIRRALPLLGLAFFVPVALAACLWWVAFHRPDWIDKLPYGAAQRLQPGMTRLYQARLQQPSVDANGNGMPDWYEVSQGLDPRTHREFLGRVRFSNAFLYVGERTPLHLVVDMDDNHYRDVRWPTDTELTITSEASVLIPAGAPAGTPPTYGPLNVQPSPRGRIEFDVLLREATTVGITVVHTRSAIAITFPGRGTTDNTMGIALGWRLPARPSHVERQMINSPPAENTDARGAGIYSLPPTLPHLVWEPAPDEPGQYVLECARADLPEEWVGFKRKGARELPRSLLGIDDRQVFPNYHGPLLYRVIPIRVAPQRKGME